MILRSTAFAAAILALTGASDAGQLAPGSGYSLHLASFEGTVYYTVDEEGSYRVVATLASSADGLPIRFVSTLAPGQRMLISAPQSVDQPPILFEILRSGDALLVSDPVSATADTADPGTVRSALKE